MRPKLTFLGDELVQRIVAEARTALYELGVEIHNPRASWRCCPTTAPAWTPDRSAPFWATASSRLR